MLHLVLGMGPQESKIQMKHKWTSEPRMTYVMFFDVFFYNLDPSTQDRCSVGTLGNWNKKKHAVFKEDVVSCGIFGAGDLDISKHEMMQILPAAWSHSPGSDQSPGLVDWIPA